MRVHRVEVGSRALVALRKTHRYRYYTYFPPLPGGDTQAALATHRVRMSEHEPGRGRGQEPQRDMTRRAMPMRNRLHQIPLYIPCREGGWAKRSGGARPRLKAGGCARRMQRDRGARAGTLRVVPTGSEVPGPQGCALLSTEGGASGCETADERPESGSLRVRVRCRDRRRVRPCPGRRPRLSSGGGPPIHQRRAGEG